MAGRVIGKIDSFDETVETWDAYSERLGQYFVANAVEDDLKTPALLSLIGGRTYGTLRNLTAPDKPATKTYQQLVEILKTHLSPRPLVIAERFRFHKHDQKEGEAVRDYVAQIRKLSEHCEFGDTLQEALRECLVCGLLNDSIQKKLLSVRELNYQNAVDIAIAMETDTRDAVELGRHKSVPVHKVQAAHGHPRDYQPGRRHSSAISVTPMVNGAGMDMELDTGSAVSVISKKDFEKYFGRKELTPTSVKLKTYSGEVINPLGVIDVNVGMNQQRSNLPLYVIEKGGPPLFGRDWLSHIKLDWAEIHTVNSMESSHVTVTQLIERYKGVFNQSLGTLKGMKAKFILKEGSSPKFFKARSLAFSLRPAVEKELDRLVNLGILTAIDHSDWATPIVVVPKKDSSIRICGDFKVTVNSMLQVDKYPLPKIEDIFANLSGGKHFTKLDLRHAYLQMEVAEEDKEYLTINTHRGLFRYNRLVFGIASAPAIWQRTMEQVLQGIPGVQCIIDDMIITGRTDDEHLRNLAEVLGRLEKYGLHANIDKCNIFKEKIELCGHVIDGEGLHKTQDKVDAEVNAVVPETVTQLRAFLGLVNYYGKFLQNLSTVLRPLHQLLEKDTKWSWTQDCQVAFDKVKQMMVSERVLTHYDPNLPVILSCDASPFGLGAVLSHKLPSGDEKPIAFASRSLNAAEKQYAQIDKEAVGIVWGIKRFHPYLYGRHFTLVTDHQPLVSIFNLQKGTSVTTAARLQRYAMFLAGHDYSIEYRTTKLHGNADGLSRMTLDPKVQSEEEDILDDTHVYQVSQLEQLPVTANRLRKETMKDAMLSRVYDAAMRGWSDAVDKELHAYYERRNEVTVQQGCLLWGIRVIIPSSLRDEVLRVIHEGHLGVVKMKSLARSYVWWPGIDADIENLSKSCA
ncbi:uncharacterized protein K02A2.6-like [Mizuhopecten yessoensis]|uniref:uncharacterized protein K02A2.6-like n=1 Tax=Mizuhopecten yessoensis TaxID=6573 RepID=UPI000B45BDDF|nr:uncharacterized protein K02A2.6-like [Mizuhopecten yessoensis]